MKHVFIVNPTSGHGKALKIVERIEEVCKDRNIEYEIQDEDVKISLLMDGGDIWW